MDHGFSSGRVEFEVPMCIQVNIFGRQFDRGLESSRLEMEIRFEIISLHPVMADSGVDKIFQGGYIALKKTREKI